MSGGEDITLLQAVARGDEDALVQLYDRYGRQAFGLAYRILGDAASAEEVVQDAFLALWHHARLLTMHTGSARAWLLTVVRNRAIDHLRRRRGQVQLVSLDAVVLPSIADDTAREIIERVQRADLLKALDALPKEQREVVELAYFEGLTHHEIATRLRIPLGTVKSRLRLALLRLGRTLEGYEGEAPDATLTDEQPT